MLEEGWRLNRFKECMLPFKGPKCFVSWTLQGSPCYRGAIFTGQASHL